MQQETDASPASIDPQERLKHLIHYSNAIEVDYHIPPTRYYRSGLEMVRMANVYYEEGSLENAYVLYLKFMTLFLEKIRKHPEFNSVPTTMKAINQAKVREVLPKAEKLKAELLRQYQVEYTRLIADLKERQRLNKERKESESKISVPAKTGPSTVKSGAAAAANYLNLKPALDVTDIQYPDPNLSSAPPAESVSPPKANHSVVLPVINRSNKPSSNTYGSSFGSSKSGLRVVIVPGRVMHVFQSLAQKNTINNIETCGILAGKLERDELFITHIIIPKQRGTSDSCTTMNEEEIFDFQDTLNLITIGWIHTHPTQTAFLSSVDLHTHCPYQLLMPEAIAIVCAPRYNETGFFMLTPNYGLEFVANCRKSGFHPHPTEPPLFMVAEHIRIDQEASLEILDLR